MSGSTQQVGGPERPLSTGGGVARSSGPLVCRKELFSLPPDVRYLNCAYMSPLPRASEEAMVAGVRRKRNPSTIEPSDFFRDAERVRTAFARVVDGAADRVAILPSASYGVAIAARSLPVERGQSIVILGEQFPGNVYMWRRVAEEAGGSVRTVEAPEGPDRGRRWTTRILEAIDADTAIVSLPHVHWTDGTRFDLEAIGERARSQGAALVVDGTQSVGAYPFDVDRIRPDLLVCAGYKWLLGPYSLAVAWVGPRLDDGAPLEETWMAREGSEDFQRLVDYRDEYQPGARRYDVGEVANFGLLPGLLSSLELVGNWGADRIQDYCRALTRELMDVATSRGFEVESASWRGEHLFGLRMRDDVELDALKRALDRAGVIASLRGTALRVSPNAYNDDADVAALTEILATT